MLVMVGLQSVCMNQQRRTAGAACTTGRVPRQVEPLPLQTMKIVDQSKAFLGADLVGKFPLI